MKITEQLKPGSELDRLVAEKMGYRWQTRPGGLGDQVGRWVDPGTGDDAFPAWWSRATGLENPQYSTEIGAAWEVVEFAKKTFGAETELSDNRFDPRWMARFKFYAPQFHAIIGIGETAPHAICLAFLSIETAQEAPGRPERDQDGRFMLRVRTRLSDSTMAGFCFIISSPID